MQLKVYDAEKFKYPAEIYRYRNAEPICVIEVPENPEQRHFIKALRDTGLFTAKSLRGLRLYDMFSCNGVYTLVKGNEKPVFDMFKQ